MTVGQPTDASLTPAPQHWSAINWPQVRQVVRRLQMRIAKATQAGRHLKDEALSPMGYMMEEVPIAEPSASIREAVEVTVRRLIEITSQQQQTQRTLLDWLRVEYAIERPSNKLLAVTDLDSDTWVGEVKRIRGKKQPLTAAGVHGLRDEYTRSIELARALAAETSKLECTLSDLVNQAYGLTPAEIELLWQTAPPRMPIPHPLFRR